MEIARCKRGHFYDKSESRDCPECAALGQLKSVPVEPVQPAAPKIAKCDKGHYYDGSLGACPVCAAAASRPVVEDNSPLVRCPEGHLYDSTVHRSCPECAAMEDDLKTVPVSQLEPSLLITQCENGHYFDAGLGACPICAAGASGSKGSEQKLVQCPVGHLYDPKVNPQCPECAAMDDDLKTVPVSQSGFSMEIVQCEKGHYYDRGLGDCPICAAAPKKQEPENKLVTCEKGHMYDPAINPQCPFCAAEEDDLKTIPVSQSGFSMEIVQCEKGHYYDRGLGNCPICAAAKPLEESTASAQEQAEMQTVSRAVFEYTQQCEKGHYYKPGLKECPICAAEKEEERKTVPVSQSEFSMEIVRCDKGHYYDRSLGDCPICAEGKPVQINLMTCKNGHTYDPVITPECPECARKKQQEAAPSIKAVKCEKGHYYDAALGICPICMAQAQAEESFQLELEEEFEEEFEEEIQEEQEIPVAVCSAGHRYDPSVYAECPFCAQEKENARQECRFAEIEDMKNTLLFTASRGMSFRLWKDEGDMKLTARSLVHKPALILEKTVSIPEQEAAAIAYKIQSALFQWELDLDRIFSVGENPWGEDARLLFRTVQINCDYRWKESFGGSSMAADCMYQIHSILGRSFDALTQGDNSYSLDRDNLWAELEFGYNPVCRIYAENGKCWLELQDRFYYQFVSSIVLTGRVELPIGQAQALRKMLAESGIMEALIRKNALPNEGMCIDPGFATGFYLKQGDLTFSYRDWNKSGGGAGKAEMEKAYDSLLQAYEVHLGQ